MLRPFVSSIELLSVILFSNSITRALSSSLPFHRRLVLYPPPQILTCYPLALLSSHPKSFCSRFHSNPPPSTVVSFSLLSILSPCPLVFSPIEVCSTSPCPLCPLKPAQILEGFRFIITQAVQEL